MTRKRLERELAKLGLSLDETITPHAIDIIVDAPKGFQFGAGTHLLVTHWFTDYPLARDAALADAKANLPLSACRPDCDCRLEDCTCDLQADTESVGYHHPECPMFDGHN